MNDYGDEQISQIIGALSIALILIHKESECSHVEIQRIR